MMSGPRKAWWQESNILAYIKSAKAKKTIFNLNVDDLTPQKTDCIDTLFLAFYNLKGLKIDAFIIPNYSGKFDIRDHPIWVDQVKHLITHHNLNICLHGLEHDHKGVPEFRGLNTKQCLNRLIRAERILKECDIPYSSVFRAPRWRISIQLLQALKELKIEILGLNWTQKPSIAWEFGMDVVYCNGFYHPNRIFPSASQYKNCDFTHWYNFSDQVICHGHFGNIAFDRFNGDTKFDAPNYAPKETEFKYLHEVKTFREITNENPSIQAICQ